LDGQCTADVVMKRFIEIITNWDYKSVVGILGKTFDFGTAAEQATLNPKTEGSNLAASTEMINVEVIVKEGSCSVLLLWQTFVFSFEMVQLTVVTNRRHDTLFNDTH
jgi:hypothetical protein